MKDVKLVKNLYALCAVLTISIVASIVYPSLSLAAVEVKKELLKTPEKVNDLLDRKQITTKQVPNPHWSAQGCAACHKAKPSKNNLKLRTKNVEVMCGNCHDKLSRDNFFHPTEIEPSKSKKQRMSKSFKKFLKNKELSNGKINCLTCHDVIKQCYTSKFKEKGNNHEFFRDGPYTSRTALCFNCHDKKKYKRFNPHEQISKSGEIYKASCLMCHKNSKNIFNNTSLEQQEFNVGKEWKNMCTGCHPWKPHPGGELSFGKKVPNHLVVPSKYTLKTMQKMIKKKKLYFPLEPHTGKVYCGTCHNVHEKGILKSAIKQKGSNSKFRLREKNMCKNCHDLY